MSSSTTPRVEVENGDVFERLGDVGTNSAHCAIIDYPWEFKIQNGTGRFEHRHSATKGVNTGFRDIEDEARMFDMESDERVPRLLDELSRVLVDGSWAVFMADDRFQDILRNNIRDSKFVLRRNWAWTPECMGMGYYGRVDHYPMPVTTLGDTDRHVTDRSTLFRVPGGRQTEYPTGKPVDLYRQILRPPVIKDGERLLEPFCGSGPGAAVANERGLDYWGCDVDVDAVEQTEERFEQASFTGQMTFGVEK